jgi:hypothetical protein
VPAPASSPLEAATTEPSANAAAQPASRGHGTAASDATPTARQVCPPDPEAEQQAALAPQEERDRWPAVVRLRIRVRANGRIDCVRPVGASHPDFIDDCERQLEGRRHLPQRDRNGEPIDAWLTYLCEFEPKR